MRLTAFVCAISLLGAFGCRAYGTAAPDDGKDMGPVRAPDFTGADRWLNTDDGKPIAINDLKGQVVLLDFWTYCCINCIHIFPDLHYLEQKYHDQPVVVIGVHSGKFDQEKDPEHIREAVLRYNILHPVAVDDEFAIWNAFGVQAWPTQILIDPKGYVVAAWTGERHRDAIDKKISQLLDEGRANGTLAKPMQFKAERETFKSGTLEFPGKLLADQSRGRLFISDTNHNRVLVTDLSGKISRVIGAGTTGLKDGSFEEAQFRQPQGLALSSDGATLYVADTGNHAVRAASLSQGIVTTIAGTGEQGNRLADEAAAKETPLSSPWDLALVGHRLFVAMAGVHQIWALDLDKKTIGDFAGTGHEGNRDAENRGSWFAQPSGLTTDGKLLFVADSETSSIRSVELTENGQSRTLAGSGDLFGFGSVDGPGMDARFQHPVGVAVTGDTLYVADTLNNVIRAIDLKTNRVSTFLGTGKTDSGADNAPNLYEPGGVSIGGNTLYIADTNHHRVIAVDLSTRKTRVLNVRMP